MAKNTLSFVCQNCGAAHSRWQGKCESCDEWNTLVEEDTGSTSMPVSVRSRRKGRKFALETLTGKSHEAPRLPSGMAEFDRVTGGGFVRGSVLLVGGDPGIGKSTLSEGTVPRLIVIDSIQTMWTDTVESAPGTVTQVRASAQALIRFAKKSGAAIILVGHVTKDGQIAGPAWSSTWSTRCCHSR